MSIPQNKTFSFTGHETFYCRYLWLKKGCDFVSENKEFSKDDAIVDLGVGKNMISSIRFWLKAFDLIDSNDGKITLSRLAKKIFLNNGFDPYLENIGTIWLLHYFLIKKQKASIYSIVFNEYRKEKTEFDKTQLLGHIKRLCDKHKIPFNPNTIDNDIKVFVHNYLNREDKGSVEDIFSNFLSELNLVEKKAHPTNSGDFVYIFEKKPRKSLPIAIILFTILDNFEGRSSISLNNLLNEFNSPGNVFVLHEDDLKLKIMQITEKYPEIIFRENAGISDIQIKGNIDKWEVLKDFYAN